MLKKLVHALDTRSLIHHTSPRSKGRRSRSQSQIKVMQKTWNIFRKRYRIVEIHPSYRKSRSPERMAGSDFWPKAP